MLADRHDLPLSTASAAAREAYVAGSELLLTLYPGALEAFDAAIAADPGFALAHAGRAQVLLRGGDAAGARASLAAARAVAAGLPGREASQLGFLDLLIGGLTEAAIAALQAHLADWPRDAMVLATAANPNGLIGASGRLGQKRMIAALLDGLAPRYGDDPWFLAHHAMALSEDGQRDRARPLIARSLAQTTRNAHAAHTQAHICYEDGATEAARGFLAGWLADYPRDGFFHGHLSWHLALGELAAGHPEAALRIYRETLAPGRHSGAPQQHVTDGVAFLWRWELAGYPRDVAAWRLLQEHAARVLPQPGNGLADLHALLAAGVTGEAGGHAERLGRIDGLAAQRRYASGGYVPALAAGFAAFERGDFPAAIAALGPLLAETERIGGSRAQHDLIGFTLLRAMLGAGDLAAARALLAARRPGPDAIPVAGLAALH